MAGADRLKNLKCSAFRSLHWCDFCCMPRFQFIGSTQQDDSYFLPLGLLEKAMIFFHYKLDPSFGLVLMLKTEAATD